MKATVMRSRRNMIVAGGGVGARRDRPGEELNRPARSSGSYGRDQWGTVRIVVPAVWNGTFIEFVRATSTRLIIAFPTGCHAGCHANRRNAHSFRGVPVQPRPTRLTIC
jgi:hypothetical protein